MLGRIDGDVIADGWYVLFNSGQETTLPVDCRDFGRVAVLPCGQLSTRTVTSPSGSLPADPDPHSDWSASGTHFYPIIFLHRPLIYAVVQYHWFVVELPSRIVPAVWCPQVRRGLTWANTIDILKPARNISHHGTTSLTPKPFNPTNHATAFNALVDKTKHHTGVTALGVGVFIVSVTPTNFTIATPRRIEEK